MANLNPPLDENNVTPLSVQIIQGAATPLDHKKRNKGKKPPIQSWQYKAYDYYEQIVEVYYGANFTGNCLARIRLVGGEVGENLSAAPIESSNETIKDVVRNFTNQRSGQTGLMRRFGQNIFLAGEAFIHGDEDEDGEQNWEVYSPLELQDNGNGTYTLTRQTGEEADHINNSSTIIRVWKEHPKFAFDPDSAMLACQAQCEKLLTLDKQDMSIAKSRFAGAGLLLFPSEIIPPAIVDDSGNFDDNPANSPFIRGIQNAMIEPIIGTEQPEDVVPSIVVGQADYLKEVRHLTMEKPINQHSEKQKMEAIRRMATAMDLPNEVLLGMADTNHWTAWQIKEETFQTHIRPFVEMICNSITVAYLWPALKKLGVQDYKKYIVWYDDTNLVARPDKSLAAQKAYEAIAISDAAYRRDMGFNEDDAPDQEEFVRRAALAMRNPDIIRIMDGEDDPDTIRGNIQKHDAASPFPQDKSRPDPNQPGPAKSAQPGPDTQPSQKGTIQASAVITIPETAVGYLEASLDRALEKAGAKVRTSIPKKSELAQYIAGYSNEEVYGKIDTSSKNKYKINDEEYLDFEPAVKYLQNQGINPLTDWEDLKNKLREEALRKSNNKNFSLNLDNLPI